MKQFLKNLLKRWFGRRECFLPGQRVRLVANYPADMADEAHRRHLYGTVQPVNPLTSVFVEEDGLVLVVFDGYPGGRLLPPGSLSGVVFDERLNKITFNPAVSNPQEEEAKSGLEVARYRGKWQAAKKEASRRGLKGKDYWLAVRVIFIELGGQYTQK